MKSTTFIFGLFMFLLASCTVEPETVIQESTVVVPQTVEVTRQVEVIVEVTRLVEIVQQEVVEVTRIEEVVITATPEPTPKPTETPTPSPVPTQQEAATAVPVAGVKTRLLNAMITTRDDLLSYGGYIDAALRGSPFSCVEVVGRHDEIVNSPTFDVSGASIEVQGAHGAYRAAIDQFSNGVRDMVENCRQAIENQTGTTIPALQWTIARSEINSAVDILNNPINDLSGA